MTQRRLLVTNALPYANGPLHLGHLLEFTQADIWTRFQRLRGHECWYVGADDTHGTAIMLKAEQRGISPEALLQEVHAEHRADLKDFHIALDHYYTTHSEENRVFAETIYQRLHEQGFITQRTIDQLFDPEKQMFLPDRFVKGACPRCKAVDQYGDNCEVCGASYNPIELIDPRSTLSGATPILKPSLHYFFDLPQFETWLRNWTRGDQLQESITHKLDEWFTTGLQAWDISRDAPYFGFKLPNTENKYFYVWLDAPVGYMASFKHLCAERPELKFDDFWGKDSTTELYHFIGKDIVYFHALFWPAMLKGSDFRVPTAIFAHGFITIGGVKMSKSKGTFITARDYLNRLKPEYLRYYFAAKLSGNVEDFDLSWEDFVQRVNADLVGKVVNIASRTFGFISKYFDHRLTEDFDKTLWQQFVDAGDEIAQHYEQREYSKAMRQIMALADKANQLIAEQQPWALVKQPETLAQAHRVCTLAIHLFQVLMVYLKPVLPETANLAEQLLNIAPLQWDDRSKLLGQHTIRPFTPLMQRVDPLSVQAWVQT